MILMNTNYTPGMKFVRVAWQLSNNYFIYYMQRRYAHI